jgi:glycosyltransferase involved in cell wall biosynthesis
MSRHVRPITVFTPSHAGAENTNAQNLTVKEIVARLPEDEFHVTMLCDGDGPDERLASRCNTRLVKWRKHGNTLSLLRHCLFPPPDIYFFPRTGPLDGIFFDLRNRFGLRTAVVTYIVMALDAVSATGLLARSILEGDTILANSKYVAETVRQRFGVEASPIYDGIDRRFYFPPDKERKNPAPIILYAGSLQPRKRVEIVIRQAARLPWAQFRIAGKGETEIPCRYLAQQLGCRNVSFLGHLPSDSLGREMRNADVFLFPSIVEGNPQVLLQAAACGLPCVAMDAYRSDYVINGKTGFLARSDTDLNQALDWLVNDSALRSSFAAAAVEHTNQFNWEEIAGQWASVFSEAAARGPLSFRKKAS